MRRRRAISNAPSRHGLYAVRSRQPSPLKLLAEQKWVAGCDSRRCIDSPATDRARPLSRWPERRTGLTGRTDRPSGYTDLAQAVIYPTCPHEEGLLNGRLFNYLQWT